MSVISISGAPVPGAGEPNRDLIETLESHLERARRGEIVAAAYVVVTTAEDMETGWEDLHHAVTKYTLCAGANILASRLNQQD